MPSRLLALAAERRRAAGADPLVAAVVALLLLAQALLEQLLQLLEIEALGQRALFGRELVELELGVLEPLEQLFRELDVLALDALELGEERLVEGVEVRLAVHAAARAPRSRSRRASCRAGPPRAPAPARPPPARRPAPRACAARRGSGRTSALLRSWRSSRPPARAARELVGVRHQVLLLLQQRAEEGQVARRASRR